MRKASLMGLVGGAELVLRSAASLRNPARSTRSRSIWTPAIETFSLGVRGWKVFSVKISVSGRTGS